MPANTKIEVAVTTLDSRQWAREAERLAQGEARELGINYRDAEVFVTLPEKGRCMRKSAGYLSLTAYG